MKTIIRTISIGLLAIIIFSVSSCKQKRELNLPKTTLTADYLIPKPVTITATNESFPLDKYTAILTSEGEKMQAIGTFLAEKVNTKTGLTLKVNSKENKDIESIIKIQLSEKKKDSNPEAYDLSIHKDSIIISAASEAGAFRGIQTLRQLIPEQSNDTITDYKIWILPTGEITDYPQFNYRATMLDVSRHFFSVADVKKHIDALSFYKINTLHLHLSDDQGWRIEIKSWPKLTEIGAQTEVGGGAGGFYTQEEYVDLVNYAAERYITIVPEIDMPGHTNAASLAYPFLNGNGKKIEPYIGTGVGFSTFDCRKDTVYAFIDDVVREVAALSPGAYFHIGGDESHSTKKEDYKYFVERVSKIVKKYGKQMIGWDEIANTDISENSIIHFWYNKENAQKGATKGMKVILSPAQKAYLDMKYDKDSKFGLTWAALIPVDSAYNWSPETFAEIPRENILGIEAPLWSETISNIDELEYLAFPRIIGTAELGWTIPENRNWEDYKGRLANQTSFLEQMQIKYYPSKLIDWKK